MIIEDISSYIEESDIATEGTDLFVGELPFDKNDCISLVYTPSPEPNKALHYYVQVVDVWGRFSNYQEGYAKMLQVFKLFHRTQNYETDNFHIYLSYSLGMIADNGRDVERRHLFQLSLGFIYRELEELS